MEAPREIVTNVRHVARSKLEIISAVLTLLSKRPYAVTEIMYEAKLAHRELKNYLARLEKRGLVERADASSLSKDLRRNPRIVYRITKKGSSALAHAQSLEEALEPGPLEIA